MSQIVNTTLKKTTAALRKSKSDLTTQTAVMIRFVPLLKQIKTRNIMAIGRFTARFFYTLKLFIMNLRKEMKLQNLIKQRNY